MTSSIYWIHHLDHTDMFTQGYIGVTNNTNDRFEEHKNRTRNAHLKNAINKYGWDNLVKKVIIMADEAYCLMIESQLRPSDNIGWNIVIGGGKPPKAKKGCNKGKAPWNKGKSPSEETRLKISLANIGKQSWNKGQKTPEHIKLKLSLAKLGKPGPRLGSIVSEETKQKISVSKKGKRLSDDVYKKQALSRTGFKHELVKCPHCSKIGGITAMPRWHFNNCKFKEN